eukprot:5385696-Pyramimonas_sp.AAC.1
MSACIAGYYSVSTRRIRKQIHIYSLLPPSRERCTVELYHRHMAAAKESEAHRKSGVYRE